MKTPSEGSEIERLLTESALASQAARQAVAESTDPQLLRSILEHFYPQDEVASFRLLRRIFQLDPGGIEAPILAARLAWQDGDNAEASAWLMHAEKIDPDDPRVSELKVRLSFTLAEKLTNLQQIVEHHPDRPEFAAQLEREKAKAEDPEATLWPPGQHPPNRNCRLI